MSCVVDEPYEGLQACTAALDCQAKQRPCLAWVMHSPSAAWPSHPLPPVAATGVHTGRGVRTRSSPEDAPIALAQRMVPLQTSAM